jgi:hypothetical protein
MESIMSKHNQSNAFNQSKSPAALAAQAALATPSVVSAPVVAEATPAIAAPVAKVEPVSAPVVAAPAPAFDYAAEIARLKAENEALKSGKGRSVTMKISEKGALSVYGLGRFPVTLYKGQWAKLLAITGEIKAFIDGPEGAKLATKDDK